MIKLWLRNGFSSSIIPIPNLLFNMKNTYHYYLAETSITRSGGKIIEDPIDYFEISKDVFFGLRTLYSELKTDGSRLIYKAVPFKANGGEEMIIEELIFNVPLSLGTPMKEANNMLSREDEKNREYLRLINEVKKEIHEKNKQVI